MLEILWLPKTTFPTPIVRPLDESQRVLTITRSQLLARKWNGMEYNTHGSLALWTPAFAAAASRSQDGACGCCNARAVGESLTGGYRRYMYCLEVLGQLNLPEEKFSEIIGQPSCPKEMSLLHVIAPITTTRTHLGNLDYGLNARTMAATWLRSLQSRLWPWYADYGPNTHTTADTQGWESRYWTLIGAIEIEVNKYTNVSTHLWL